MGGRHAPRLAVGGKGVSMGSRDRGEGGGSSRLCPDGPGSSEGSAAKLKTHRKNDLGGVWSVIISPRASTGPANKEGGKWNRSQHQTTWEIIKKITAALPKTSVISSGG